MDAKTKAIVAHITIIGWIIALILNNQNAENKDEFTSFYLRQMLGLFLTGVVLGWVPILGLIIGLVLFVFWIISLIGAINGEEKVIPVVGKLYQQWFKGL